MVRVVNDSLRAIRCCRQHALFYCLITLCLLPPSYVHYRHWEISFLLLYCWIKIGFICSCKLCGATYLIWELEMDINFEILQHPRAPNRRKAMDNTYGKHAERVHMKECRQQANLRHQRLYRQHNTLLTCYRYKPTWSRDWSCRDWKPIAYWAALCEIVCTLWNKTFFLFNCQAKKKKPNYFFDQNTFTLIHKYFFKP